MDQATLAVTRVAAGDDGARYDPPAMALHWLTALLVLTLWTLAQAWDFLQRGTPRATSCRPSTSRSAWC